MNQDLISTLQKSATEAYEKVLGWRRDFHAHPELSGQEVRTSAIVAAHLRSLGLEVQDHIAGYGIVALLRGEAGAGPVVGFRADMDALPLEEATGLPYASRTPGVMHACGHDAHTAMLMGAAEILSQMRAQICGTVKFIFQPAEERGGGAKAMVDAGVLENPGVDVLLGMHLLFNESGTLAFKRGYALTASDSFSIQISGKGGHGAKPHETNDVVLTACQLVTQLHQIVSRKVNPQQMGILSVGAIHSGNAGNVLPTEATLSGTVRTLKKETQAVIRQGIEDATKGVCQFTGASYSLNYAVGNPAVYNSSEVMDHLKDTFLQFLPEEKVIELYDTRCGSEDFSNYTRAGMQTGYFWLGGAFPGENPPSTNHQPYYHWDERTMETGILASCAAILSYLIP